MAKHIVNAETRTEFGKGPVGRLRRQGKIPAIIYGATEPAPVTLDAVEFGRTFRHVTESTLLTLKRDGKDHEVLIKAWDEDYRTGDLLHVDFYEVSAGKTLHTRIPVHITGSSPGEREGGVLQTTLHEIEIECLPKDIPDDGVTVDVSELQIGDAVHLSDIEAPEGVTFLTSGDQVVVQVTAIREPVLEEEEEEEIEEGELGEEGEVAEGEETEESEEE